MKEKAELAQRKWVILRAIVWDYVATAEPVGSEALVQRYNLGVKPATVRHEMAEMLELGYLKQPHTSAGRVPSDVGYRYYVNRIGDPAPPAADVRLKLKGLQRVDDVSLLLGESVRLLARMSDYIAVATTIKNETVRVQETLLTPVAKDRVLLVMVFSNAHVENRMLEAGTPNNAQDLHQAGELLAAGVGGRSVREIARARIAEPQGASSVVEEIYLQAAREVKAVAKSQLRGKMLHDGIANLLAQPEFRRDVASLQQVLALLEDETTLEQAMNHAGPGGSAVMIGAEGSHGVEGCSVVASTFTIGGAEAGAIGLLGPTRMRYDDAVSLVRYTAQVLSDTLTRLVQN